MTGLFGGEESRSPFAAIRRWWSDWIRDDFASQLSCCGEMEVERIARDMRMTPAELRAVVQRGLDAADLLLSRMAALDLDPAEVSQVGPQTFRDLQRACALCESKRRCARDLAQDAAMPAWQDYCPNVATLTALDVLPWESRRDW